jgi:class 3 adenylate cyclase/tetratricopeptide (TPR) repeat protein
MISRKLGTAMNRDLAGWLKDLGLEQYAQAFADNGVGFDLLPELTPEDLKELGIARLGDRKRLLKAITELSAAGKPQESGAAAAVIPVGERRQVTVLFADLTGFTQMSSELGAEATHELLNRYFETADAIVARCGGRVDKHIGDNVMAVFGAPVAHADDPERAVRAALDIHAAVSRLGRDLGRALSAHIGIASGQVVASGTGSDTHREYTVTGDSVNLASRLQGMAGPGQTLISEAVYRAVAARLDCDPLEAVAVKGLDKPVRVWRVKSLGMGERASAAVAFVGRRSELAQFSGMLETCRTSRTGQTIVIRGEAGIGKSRLVEEYTRIAADAGFVIHKGQILDFGGKGDDAFRSVVRSLLGVAPDCGEAERKAAAEAAIERGLLSSERRVFLLDLLDIPPSSEERARYDAMDHETRNEGKRAVAIHLLRELASASPVLIVIEDVHWADRPMLAHLAKLAAAVAECAALLILTSRVEGDPLDEAWRAQAAGGLLTTIDLGPIPREDARALVEAFMAGNAAFAERCVERAAGNPLFLEQLLRNAEEGQDIQVPGTVQSLVQARIDRLDPTDKTAVQVASVLGQRFARAALAHVLDRAEYDPERLIYRRILRPDAASEDGLLFAHALIRDAVYETLLKARRLALHRRAADWYADRDKVLQAEHLGRAEDPEAPRAYLGAARLQAEQYRHDAALRLIGNGLALATDRADRFALTSFQGELLHDIGAMTDARRAYEATLAAAGDDLERCRAWIGLAAVKRVTDDLTGALADLGQAEAAAVRHQLLPEQARIHFLRGNLCFPRGDIEGCLREHGLGLELARRSGMVELEAMALGGLGDAEYVRGRMISACDRFRRCVDVCAQNGFGRIEVANRPMMAFTRWLTGDAKGALADAEAAIAAAAKVAHRRAEMVGHHAAFFCLHALMDFDRAASEADAALALSRQLGARRFDAEALACRAELHRLAGRRAQALADAEEAVKVSRETAPAFLGPFTLGALARTTDDPAVRQQALREAEALLEAGAVSHNHLLFGRDAIDACLDAGDWQAAERYAAALESYTRLEPLPFSDFYVARGRALAALGRRSMEAAPLAMNLARLHAEGEQLGLLVALPAIERALEQLRQEAPVKEGRLHEIAHGP